MIQLQQGIFVMLINSREFYLPLCPRSDWSYEICLFSELQFKYLAFIQTVQRPVFASDNQLISSVKYAA